MTTGDILAIIGACVAGFVTAAGAIGSLIVAIRSEKAQQAVAVSATADRADKAEKLEQIHKEVNSGAAKSLETIAGLSAKVASLTGSPRDEAIAEHAADATKGAASATEKRLEARLEARLAEALAELAAIKRSET